MVKLLILTFIVSTLTSCSGYRLKSKENPFFRFGINSITIPMFLNESTISNVSGPFTRELSSYLMSFSDLRVYPGENKSADAVLLGIIRSGQYKNSSLKTSGYKISSDIAPVATGSRRKYYIPRSTSIELDINFILIRDPSIADIKLLTSDIGQHIRNNPKIIYNEYVKVIGDFTRNIHDGEAVAVNQTQNIGMQNKTINKMAEDAVNKFKETILYAF